jgi:hypothetical protein
MVELSTRKREIRGDGGNHHEKQGLERISCASQLIIPDTAGTSPDLAGTITDKGSSKPNQASRTPDFSLPLVFSISFSSSSPSPSFLSTTLPSSQEHKVKSSLSISPCHHRELTRSASYTERSIHRVQHTPKIICRHFILTISS